MDDGGCDRLGRLARPVRRLTYDLEHERTVRTTDPVSILIRLPPW